MIGQPLRGQVGEELGGATAASNLQAAEFAVAINILGQIHSQVRDLPPGSSVAVVSIS